MLKVFLIVFLVNSTGEMQMLGQHPIKTIEECVARSSYINSQPEKINAGCYFMEVKNGV
jgi:hypothetical protein